jgi:hypothetical protein
MKVRESSVKMAPKIAESNERERKFAISEKIWIIQHCDTLKNCAKACEIP